jgi:hypothetical protein
MRSALAILVPLCALLCGAAGCAAPTLPLPPPTALVEGPPDVDGIVTVSGEARPGAFVGCLNQNSEVGVIVRADVITGAYSVRMAAEFEDTLSLWQFEGTSSGGQQIDVVVPRE